MAENPNRVPRRQTPTAAESPALPASIPISYRRSNFNRVIHADGAYGGLTAHASIYMALYSEHVAMPETTQMRFDHTLHTAKEERPQQTGVTREVETEVIMSIETAQALRDWLQSKIEQYSELKVSGALDKSQYTTQE